MSDNDNAEGIERIRDKLKEIDRRRGDWERESALLEPQRERMERGRKALELWDSYSALRALRQALEQNRTELSELREDVTSARSALKSAEEACSLMESEFRERLAEQKRLVETAQKVQEIDAQLLVRREAAEELRAKIDQNSAAHKECTARVDGGQSESERIGISLREARKYLQTNAIDERLIAGMAGINKCFGLFVQAKEKRKVLKEAYSRAIQKKQRTQDSLNDRQMMLSDISNKFSIAEKDLERAQSLFESVLKGKTLTEWRGIYEQSLRKLDALEELSKKFSGEQELREREKTLQERRRMAQQEARDIDIRDAAEMGKIEELQEEVRRLERRVSLLRRIEDLDAMRELLQEGVSCPLCGAVTHPYVSGTLIPDEGKTHDQLHDAQAALNALNDELAARRARSGLLSEELAAIAHDEDETRQSLSSLSQVIGNEVSALGLRFGTGVPPLEELDRVRQKVRDQLQGARNTLDSAEAAEHDVESAKDELDKIRDSRLEMTRYHQEALFQLKADSADEERIQTDVRSQEETFSTVRRELVSLLSPYGYKSIPDENPESVIEALTRRLEMWKKHAALKESLEREQAVAQASMTALRNEQESIRRSGAELSGKLKSLDSERESLRQQRIILFSERDPAAETERMEREIEDMRRQLEARREAKSQNSALLQNLMNTIHNVETDMATQREQIQRGEIDFGKRLLASGFKNEDDFLSSRLSDDERRELQSRLNALAREDMELTEERENALALMHNV